MREHETDLVDDFEPVAPRRLSSPMVAAIEHETLEMLMEARSHMAQAEARRLEARRDPSVIYYRMLVTNRLVWSMAWVLHQKAVANGEMSADQAARAMADIHFCGEDTATRVSPGRPLPDALASLLDRSESLIARVIRLVSLANGEPRTISLH